MNDLPFSVSASSPFRGAFSPRSSASFPQTVNLHLVAFCNMKCGYCYARFEAERQEPRLPAKHLVTVMQQLTEVGVRRVTFAGGEPTLHRELQLLLRKAGELGLVTSIVTNGTRIDAAWLAKHGPYLRWLTLSIDSIDAATARAIGRHSGQSGYEHPTHVLEVADLVHRWNSVRPPGRRSRLKLNITVTARNAHEDPRPFIHSFRPEKVKLLQMLLVEGENDDARDLACSSDAFHSYVQRVRDVGSAGPQIVVEDNEAMDGSYAMVDPLGRFFQRVDGKYARSEPIHEVGVEMAWNQVGGFDSGRFAQRGGDYDPGHIATGNLPFLIVVEGLDGTGKSTTVKALAERLRAKIVHNPPSSMASERADADRQDSATRRAWYLKANREAARQAEEIRASGWPVVMDRSVASTIAFGAAECNEPVGPWPADIPKPDLLAILNVGNEERKRRLASRSGQRTSEETRIDADSSFRQRILDNYAALGGLIVDANGPVDDVVHRILRAAEAPRI